MRARLLLALSVLASAGAQAAMPGGAEPNPFRLDSALQGRTFNYNTESFLHRYAYRFDFPLVGGELWPEGFHGGSASVRSDEFESRWFVRKTVPLGERGGFIFRYRRDQDFDGNWDQAWVGMQWRFTPEWSATLLGDVPGDKEFVDGALELAWTGGDGGRFRAAIIAPDFQYNGKQSAARYDRQPWTYFVERWWSFVERGVVYAYANLNTPVEYREFASGLELDDERREAGLGLRLPLSGEDALLFALEGSDADRETRDGVTTRTLAREHLAATAEWRTGRNWLGLRAFHFDEELADSLAATTTVQRRRERMIYAGREWRLSERTRFRPELLLNYYDNRDELTSPIDPDRSGLQGKLALPFFIVMDTERGALVVLDPSITLHDFGFGGARVQLVVPF